jgi:hypothetical protein
MEVVTTCYCDQYFVNDTEGGSKCHSISNAVNLAAMALNALMIIEQMTSNTSMEGIV